MQGCFCSPSGAELLRSDLTVCYLLCSDVVRSPEDMAAAAVFPPLGHLSEVLLEPGARSHRVWATPGSGQPWHPHRHCGSLQSRSTAVSKEDKARPQGPVPRKDLRITESPESATYMLTSTPSPNGGELWSLKAHADSFSS